MHILGPSQNWRHQQWRAYFGDSMMTLIFALELAFLKPMHLSYFCAPLLYYKNSTFRSVLQSFQVTKWLYGIIAIRHVFLIHKHLVDPSVPAVKTLDFQAWVTTMPSKPCIVNHVWSLYKCHFIMPTDGTPCDKWNKHFVYVTAFNRIIKIRCFFRTKCCLYNT